MGEGPLFFSPCLPKTSSANVWHCLPESHLKCIFLTASSIQPCCGHVELLASTAPAQQMPFQLQGSWV